CDRCHNVFGFNVLNAKPDFDHNSLTDFALKGQHETVPCRKCHKDRRKFAPVTHKECSSCHKDPHQGIFSDFTCSDCHQEKAFDRLIFPHEDKTGYKLEGTHARTDCTGCHKKEQWQNLTKVCAGCHAEADPHRNQFGKTGCEKCHAPTKWDE